jgi:hypothetical protein
VGRGLNGLQTDLETLDHVTIPLGPLTTAARTVCTMVDSGSGYDTAAARIRPGVARYGVTPTIAQDVATTAYTDVCRAG